MKHVIPCRGRPVALMASAPAFRGFSFTYPSFTNAQNIALAGAASDHRCGDLDDHAQ